MRNKKKLSLTMVVLTVFTLIAELLIPSLPVAATELPEAALVEPASDVWATGYVDLEDTLPEDENPAPEISTFSLEQDLNQDMAGEGLPAAYRSDQVSGNGVTVSYLPDAMRDQNPLGTCWAFSALGACEASMIRKGLATGSIDLSERHFLYYFYNKGITGDTFGGTSGDYDEAVLPGWDYLSQGSNNQMTMWSLVSWCGPVKETVAPYRELAASSGVDRNGLLGQENSTFMAYESDACHVQNAYMLEVGNMGDSAKKDRLKKLIMEYGALGMSYYSVRNRAYDCAKYDSYYNDTYVGTNHAIQVVGWDDNFPKENFAKEAPGDGAWLMKNSWGQESDSWAQYGYFWISYYDTSVNNNGGKNEPTKYAFVFDAEPADNYDYIHQYDGDGSIANYKTLAAANRFTAGSTDGGWEVLKSVGIGVAQSNVLCRIEIYKNLTDPKKNPTSGELVTAREVRLNYIGYHTIPLDEEVELEPGCEYSVVCRFPETDAADAGSYVPVFTSRDRQYTTGGQPFIKVITYENPDVSFYQTADCTWVDLTEHSDSTNRGVFRIKAYTDRKDGRDFAVSHSKLNLKVGDTARIQTNISAGTRVTWSGSDGRVIKVTPASDGTYGDLQALAAGSAQITIKTPTRERICQVTITEKEGIASKPGSGENTEGENEDENENGNGDEIKDKEVTPAVLTGLKLDKSTITVVSGKSIQLKATPVYSPGTVTPWKVYWKSSNTGVATVSSTGKVKAVKPGKATITVYNGSIKATCAVTVKPGKTTFSSISLTSAGKAKLEWKKVSGATGYVIYRATSENGTYKKVKTIGKASTVTVTLAASDGSKPYYYKLRAYKTISGKMVYGEYSTVRTCGASRAGGGKAKALKDKKIQLTWSKASKASGYVIYRATKKNGTYNKIKAITKGNTVTFTDKSLKKGKTYYYKIRSYRLIKGKKVYAPYSAVFSAKAK